MIKLFEMFAGYGGASFSLKRLGIEHEVVGYSEIKPNAIKIFEMNHKEIKNFGDCTKINPNELPDFDLLTGGFPCQPFSEAGLRKGELDTKGTLFNEIIRIAEVKKPKMMLLENVRGLTFENNKGTFKKILSELDRIGYVVRWKVLNSNEYGNPQSRKRVWFVCFLKGMDTMKFSFPEKEELKIKLKDLLEKEVDEKYYLTKDKHWMVENKRYRFVGELDNDIPTLTGGHSKGWDDFRIVEGCAIRTFPRNKPSQERKKRLEIGRKDFINCLTSVNNDSLLRINENRVRYLTPLERIRFMGFKDGEIIFEGLPPTAIMDLTGNGWDINLVSKIFQKMFNVIAPHTNFPSEFSTSGKRHNIDLKIPQQVAPSIFSLRENLSKSLIKSNSDGGLPAGFHSVEVGGNK